MTDIEEFIKKFDDTVWMTIRYAHNRHTGAPGMVRELLEVRAKLGNFSLGHYDTTLDNALCGKIQDYDDLRYLYKKYGEEE